MISRDFYGTIIYISVIDLVWDMWKSIFFVLIMEAFHKLLWNQGYHVSDARDLSRYEGYFYPMNVAYVGVSFECGPVSWHEGCARKGHVSHLLIAQTTSDRTLTWH